MNGVLDVNTIQDTSDGNTFILTHLIPHLITESINILLLYQCAIHHCIEVMEVFQEIGVLVYFLPPYSLDLNPIEEAFSKVKTELKSMNTADTEMAMLAQVNNSPR